MNILYLFFKVLKAKSAFAEKILFLKDCRDFFSQGEASSFKFAVGRWFPVLGDKTDSSGTASGHYFHQDLLVARRIFLNSPQRHVDVGSRIDGFVAHVASFREIEVFDIRPMPVPVMNIFFVQADLMNLNKKFISYTDSLSCLHALEHFGLGRYGDPVDFDGFVKGFENMKRILAPGGKFYLSVPIGPQRIEFNAHRVFDVVTILSLLEEYFQLDCFSYVGDDGNIYENVMIDTKQVQQNYGCYYGCGIFECTKR